MQHTRFLIHRHSIELISSYYRVAISMLSMCSSIVVSSKNKLKNKLNYVKGYLLSLLMNFWLSSVFTFRTEPSVKKGIKFGMCHGINYLLHLLFLNLFLWIGVPSNWAPVPVFVLREVVAIRIYDVVVYARYLYIAAGFYPFCHSSRHTAYQVE